MVLRFGVWLETKQRFDTYPKGHGRGAFARAQVQTYPVFRISETAGRNTLKFGVWLEIS